MAEFYHHGVKGQRWGVRRFRNPDGTLTPAGKKRAAKLNAEIEKRYSKESGKVMRVPKKLADKMNRQGRTYVTAKEAYKIDRAANKLTLAQGLRNIRLSEAERSFTYYERERRKETIAAAATVPLSVALAAGTGRFVYASRRTLKSPQRKALQKAYRSENRKVKETYKRRIKSDKGWKRPISQMVE